MILQYIPVVGAIWKHPYQTVLVCGGALFGWKRPGNLSFVWFLAKYTTNFILRMKLLRTHVELCLMTLKGDSRFHCSVSLSGIKFRFLFIE